MLKSLHIAVTFQNIFYNYNGRCPTSELNWKNDSKIFSLFSYFTVSVAIKETGLLGLEIGFALSFTCKGAFALVYTPSSPVNKSWYFCFIFFFKSPIFLLANFTD